MIEPATPNSRDVNAEDQFVRQVRADLDRSCAGLDGHTLSCLNRIRHAALERRARPRRSPFLLPFGGLATAAVLVMAVMLNDSTPAIETLPTGAEQLEYLDLLSAAEDLDFYEELEFYQWLADSSI